MSYRALAKTQLQWLIDPEFELETHFDSAWEVLLGGLRT
jgi:hypothetical protein